MAHCGPLQPSPFCDSVTLGSGEGLLALLPCLGEEGFFHSCCLHCKPAVATVLCAGFELAAFSGGGTKKTTLTPKNVCLRAPPSNTLLQACGLWDGVGLGPVVPSCSLYSEAFRSCLAGTLGITSQPLLADLVQMVLGCSCAHHCWLPLASSCFSCLKRQQKTLSAFPMAHFPGKVCPDGY